MKMLARQVMFGGVTHGFENHDRFLTKFWSYSNINKMFPYIYLIYPNGDKSLKQFDCSMLTVLRRTYKVLFGTKAWGVFLQSFGVRSFVFLFFQYLIFIEVLKSLWVTTRWSGSQALVKTIAYEKFMLLQTGTIDPDPRTVRTGTKTDTEVAISAKSLVTLWMHKLWCNSLTEQYRNIAIVI